MTGDRLTLSRARAWGLALVATSTMAISYLDRQTFAVIAPTVTAALSLSDTQYGWLVSSFSIAYLFSAPLAGAWVDRIGARRALLAAVLVWSAVAAAHAAVPATYAFAALLALRVALGVAESPSFPGATQVIYRALPPAERARGAGILYTGSSLGAMIAPPLATSMAAAYGWRTAFFGTALVGLLWVPAWLAVAFRQPARAHLDLAPTTAVGASRSPSFVELLRQPDLRSALFVVLAAAPVNGFVLFWGAKYIVSSFGISLHAIGAYLWLPPLAYDVGSVVFGDRLSRRMKASGRSSPPFALFFLCVACAASLALLPLAHTPLAAIAFMSFAVLGGGGLYAILTADVLARVAPERVSATGGLLAAGQSLALIIANPIVGASVDRTHSYTPAALATVAWALMGCSLWVVMKRPRRTTQELPARADECSFPLG